MARAQPRDTSGYRHGLRVRLGVTGPKGILLRCETKDGAGHYWKVRLQRGDWVWPDGCILEGPGDQVARCEACGLSFLTDQRGDGLLCPVHDEEIFGTRARAAEPPSPRTSYGRRWIRRHR